MFNLVLRIFLIVELLCKLLIKMSYIFLNYTMVIFKYKQALKASKHWPIKNVLSFSNKRPFKIQHIVNVLPGYLFELDVYDCHEALIHNKGVYASISKYRSN